MDQIARRFSRRLAIAAASFSGVYVSAAPSVLVQSAGAEPPAAPVASAQRLIDHAASLEKAGRLVEARAVLADLLLSESPDLSDSDRVAARNLMKQIDAAVKKLDPGEVSLQRAELALRDGNLRLAERHAAAAGRRPDLGAAGRERSADILREVAARRDQIAPTVPSLVERARMALAAGDTEAAREHLRAIEYSGVELSGELRQTADGLQLALVEADRGPGSPHDPRAGVLQPGTLRRLDDKPSQPPAEQIPEEPARNPEMQPADGAQPAQEAPPYQPPAEPAQDDIIATALKIEGQRLLAEGQLAVREGRYSEAIQKLETVLQSYRQYLTPEENTAAQMALDDARVRLEQPGAGNLDQDVTKTQTLQRQQAESEFANYMEQARTALAAGDTAKARDLVARARLTISRVSNVFSEPEFDGYIRQCEDLARQVEATAEAIRQQEAAAQEVRIRDDAEKARRSLAEEKARRIDENIQRVRALQMEMRYEEALQIVDQILFLDPNNPTGLLLRDILQDVVLFRRFDSIRRQRIANIAEESLESEEASIPPKDLVNYPPNWPVKSFRRGDPMAYALSADDRRVLARLDEKFPNAPFRNNTLEQFLEYVATITKAPMDVDWASLESIGVAPATPVTVNLSTVPVRKVLDTVLSKVSRDAIVDAGWSVNDGVLQIASEDDLRKTVRPELYNITDLIFDVPNYNVVPTMDLESVLQRATGDWKTVAIKQREEERTKRVDKRPSRDDRVQQLIEFIQNTVDYKGWRDNGGDTGSIQEINGNLVITNTPENHREIAGLLAKLRDIRSMQINVETRFLLVNQDFFEQIGFDVDVYFNANNNQVRVAQAADPTVQTSDFFDFSGGGGLKRTITSQGDFPAGQVGAAQFFTQGVVNPRSWSPVGAGQNSLGLGSFLSQDNELASTLLSQAPALGIAGQFLDDVQVDFLIRATQADRRTVQVTAPRLTFTNGQAANVYVATQRAFISDLTPIVGESAAAFDPVPATLTEGVTLSVEGIISADRRYVTLNVDTAVTRLDDIAEQPVTAVAGGQLVNSADTQSFIQLPQVTITRVQTTATVPDEGTVLLGGQRLTTELEVETGVPVLSKIPIINRFFTNRIESRSEQTLLILVKPTVLIQTEEEERHFPGLTDSLRSSLGG